MTLVDITIVLSLWGADFGSLRWIPCGFCALVSLISLVWGYKRGAAILISGSDE